MLLDWDKPLSEQSEGVRERLMNDPLFSEVPWNLQWDGKDIVDAITDKFVNEDAPWQMIGKTPDDVYRVQQATSEYLGRAGIPGIRYLDGDSRSAGEGSYNYVMFDDKPLEIVERGFATPESMTALAGAATTFLTARQQKKSQWDGLRSSLLDAVNQANDMAGQALEAIDLPWKGLIGAGRVAGGMMAGESFGQAMNAGANQVRQPLEQTAYDLGGAVTDVTGSPLAGTAVNAGINLGGPI